MIFFKRWLDRDLVFSILLGWVASPSFIGPLVVVLVKNSLQSPVTVGLVFVVQRTLKQFLTPMVSIMIDLIGTGSAIAISSVLTVACAWLATISSPVVAIAVAIIYGVVLNIKIIAIHAKINNVLSRPKFSELYDRAMSLMFIGSDLAMGVVIYLSAYVYEKYSYQGIFLFSIVWSLLALILACFSLRDCDRTEINKTAKAVIVNSYNRLVSRKIIIALAILLAAYDFFGWRFSQIIKLLLIDEGVSTGAVLKAYSFTKFAMCVGSIIAFYVAKRVSVTVSLIIWVCQLIATIILAFLPFKIHLFGENWSIVTVAFYAFPLLFSTMQLPPMHKKMRMIPSQLRATMGSVSMMMMLLINVVGNMIIAFLSEKYNYSIGIGIFCCIALLLTLCSIPFIPNCKSKEI